MDGSDMLYRNANSWRDPVRFRRCDKRRRTILSIEIISWSKRDVHTLYDTSIQMFIGRIGEQTNGGDRPTAQTISSVMGCCRGASRLMEQGLTASAMVLNLKRRRLRTKVKRLRVYHMTAVSSSTSTNYFCSHELEHESFKRSS